MSNITVKIQNILNFFKTSIIKDFPTLEVGITLIIIAFIIALIRFSVFRKGTWLVIKWVSIGLIAVLIYLINNAKEDKEGSVKERYYCKWCGIRYHSISSMSGSCSSAPHGRHELYDGSVKERYYCKWCGIRYHSISSMSGSCSSAPHGRHEPAL